MQNDENNMYEQTKTKEILPDLEDKYNLDKKN